MQPHIWKLLLNIIIGILLNITASYMIIPLIFPNPRNHYNINDVYMAVYVGLILSAIELIVVGIAVFILME